MVALSNPFRRGSRGWGMLVHQNYGAGGGNGSIMVGMFVCLCLVSKKPSEREFFVPAGMDLGVKLLSADVLSKQESGTKILLKAERPSCPMGLLPKCAGRTSFKKLIQGTRLNLILLWKMSVVGPDDIKDGDCKCGRVTQWPPILYA
jgi:hypothetical protein